MDTFPATGFGDLGLGVVSDGTVKNKKAKQKQQQHQKTEIHVLCY